MRKWLTQPTLPSVETYGTVIPAYDFDLDTVFALRDFLAARGDDGANPFAVYNANDRPLTREEAADLTATDLGSINVRGNLASGTGVSMSLAHGSTVMQSGVYDSTSRALAAEITAFLDREAVRRRQWQRLFYLLPWLGWVGFGVAFLSVVVLVLLGRVPLATGVVGVAVAVLLAVELARFRRFIRRRVSSTTLSHRVLPVSRKEARLQRAVRHEAARQAAWQIPVGAVVGGVVTLVLFLLFGVPVA